MLLVTLLSILVAASAAPATENAGDKTENAVDTTENAVDTTVAEPSEPDLPYSVKRVNFKLPASPFSEGRATNEGLFFVRFPQYSMNIHLLCPYELVPTEFLTKRITDMKKCISTVDLTYWSQEHTREIHLDTYKIDRKDLSDRYALDSITVYKAPEGNVHYVTLAMSDHTCRKMKYTVNEAFKVEPTNTVVDCKVVDELNKENDQWVEEHLSKAIEAAEKAEMDRADAAEKEQAAAEEKKKADTTEKDKSDSVKEGDAAKPVKS